jgi:hypothetical protein
VSKRINKDKKRLKTSRVLPWGLMPVGIITLRKAIHEFGSEKDEKSYDLFSILHVKLLFYSNTYAITNSLFYYTCETFDINFWKSSNSRKE